MPAPQPNHRWCTGHGLNDDAAIHAGSGRLARWPFLRMSGLNPLIRGSDRIEVLVAVLAFVVSLVAVPIAAAVGTAVHDSRSRVYAEQAQVRHIVTATVTDGKAVREDLSKPTVIVPARWSTGGADHTGMVSAPLKVKTGDSIDIWVDPDGSFVGPPSRTAMDEAVAAALVFWVAVAVAAAGAFASTRVALDRIRNTGWHTRSICYPVTHEKVPAQQRRYPSDAPQRGFP